MTMVGEHSYIQNVLEEEINHLESDNSKLKKSIATAIASFSAAFLSVVTIWQSNRLTLDDIFDAGTYLIPIFWAIIGVLLLSAIGLRGVFHVFVESTTESSKNPSTSGTIVLSALFLIVGIAALRFIGHIGENVSGESFLLLYLITLATIFGSFLITGGYIFRGSKRNQRSMENYSTSAKGQRITKRTMLAICPLSFIFCFISLVTLWRSFPAIYMPAFCLSFVIMVMMFSNIVENVNRRILLTHRMKKVKQLRYKIIIDQIEDDELRKKYSEITKIDY